MTKSQKRKFRRWGREFGVSIARKLAWEGLLNGGDEISVREKAGSYLDISWDAVRKEGAPDEWVDFIMDEAEGACESELDRLMVACHRMGNAGGLIK